MIQFLFGAAALLYGGKKYLDALDKKNAAEMTNKAAQEMADNATKYRDNTRIATNYSLENLGKIKISIMSDNMKTFVDNFSKLQNVHFRNSVMLDELRGFNPQSKDFLEIKNASFNASELATGGLGSLAAGTLTAAGAYGAVGALATASTGAAISGLSGVAATNATLAWLGGGSIAAGGGGMAAGTMVLGGLVAIPALVVGGLFFDEKMEKALNDANTNYDKARKYAQEIRNFCTAMNALKDKVYQIDNLLYKLNGKFSSAISTMVNTICRSGTNFNTFSSEEQDDVMRAAQLAQTIKIVIDTPLINQRGGVTAEAERLLESKQVILDKLY